MRLLERAVDRYDTGIQLLSLGRIQRVYDRVAELARGPEVLDLGCGTGAVAVVALIQQQVIEAVGTAAVGVGDDGHRIAIGIANRQDHLNTSEAGFAVILHAVPIQVVPHKVAQRAGVDVIPEIGRGIGLAAGDGHAVQNFAGYGNLKIYTM